MWFSLYSAGLTDSSPNWYEWTWWGFWWFPSTSCEPAEYLCVQRLAMQILVYSCSNSCNHSNECLIVFFFFFWQEMEGYIRGLIPNLAQLRDIPASFVQPYCRIAARKFFFFCDPARRGLGTALIKLWICYQNVM